MAGDDQSAYVNILVVDDDLQNLACIERALAAANCNAKYNLVSMTSGTSALRQLLKTEFALIVLDVSMPEMDGFEVATLIRQVEHSRRIPIIFLTSTSDPALPVNDSIGISAANCLAKPVDTQRLQAMVADLAGIPRQNPQAQQRRAGNDSETMVRQRTACLIEANELLRRDMARREHADRALHTSLLKAEAANLAKTEYLVNMTHEVRTPMTGILGMLELALETNLTAEQREYLALGKLSVAALLDVTNDILDLSKIEAGQLVVEAIPFSLRESIGDTLKMMAIDAHRKGLELAYDIAPETPDAWLGDPIRLRQVIVNLVSNAIRFTERGEVLVRVRQLTRGEGARTLHFAVSDSGIGIAAEKLKTIFAPFVQADASTSRRYGGTGLGLAIAARLVEAMGGSIAVESEPGQGSAFQFTLRLKEPAAAKASPAADFGRLRVLLAEPHPVSRRFLANTLRQWNIDVYAASDAMDAMQAIARAGRMGRPYDVAFVHHDLAEMHDGFVAAQMQASSAVCVKSLVVLDSLAGRMEQIDEPAATAHIRLTRPVKPSELQAVIGATCNRGKTAGVSPALDKDSAGREIDRMRDRVLDILLVEDDPLSSKLAQQVIKQAGHRVAVADNGVAALAALEGRHFDLVLMDMQMPVMDGVETAAMIRRNELMTGKHVAIVALSAHAMPHQHERCLAAAMDGYLVKPVRIADLRAAIERCVPAQAQPILDRNSLLERVGGDQRLLEEITAMFLDKGAQLMASARNALEVRDAKGFDYAIHTLAGMFRSLSADALVDTVNSLEAFVMKGDRQRMEACFAQLEREVVQLQRELVSMSAEVIASNASINVVRNASARAVLSGTSQVR